MKTLKTLKEDLDKDFEALKIKEDMLSDAYDVWTWDLIDSPSLLMVSPTGDLNIMFNCVITNDNKDIISRDRTLINLSWTKYLDKDEIDFESLIYSLKVELRELIEDDFLIDMLSKDCIDDLFKK